MDMGGTNFRVCKVTLHGTDGKYEITQMDKRIPDALKSGSSEDLWLYIAECMQSFVDRRFISSAELPETPLAFTFSFPVTQTSVSNGVLQRWTKGFDIDGVEGHDVVTEVQNVLHQKVLLHSLFMYDPFSPLFKGLPVQIVALVNDTTGTLIASSYVDKKIKIGSIFGTGSNAAYMERCSKISNLSRYRLPDDAVMAINCEYGAFDNNRQVLPFTEYDIEIDRTSPRPGQQCYEKLVAGLYLGEIFRQVLVEIHHNGGVLFRKQDMSQLRKPYVLDSSFLAAMEADKTENLHACNTLFRGVLSISASVHELRLCHDIARLIALRSARLYACGIAAIMKKKSFDSCHVAVDGSVFSKYSSFPERVMAALREIMEWPADTNDRVRLVPAVDGSSVGAAVIAAMITRPVRTKGW